MMKKEKPLDIRRQWVIAWDVKAEERERLELLPPPEPFII